MAVSALSALGSTIMAVATLAPGASLMLFGTQVSAFTYFAAMTGTFAALGAISRELFSQPSMDTMNGINFNVRDPAATRKIIYGKCRIGGTIVFINTSDTDNNYLHIVIAVAGHEINAYKEVYFGNTKVWENGSYVDDGTTDWEDHCLLKFHKGDQTTADTDLVDAATGFTAQHKLLDTAYIYARLDYDAEVYVSGVPNISCVVEGKKVLDPRNSTTAFSTNPALIAYDYLRDTKYGLGESTSNIDTTSFSDAATLCDGTVNIEGGTQKRYECSGILDSGSTIKNNIEDILSSMMGSIHYSGGKFHLLPGAYRAPHNNPIDVDMIVSPIQVTTRRSKRTLFNTVKGRFVSEENNYVITDYPEQADASYVTEDGEEIVMDLALPMTTNNVMAQRIAKLTLKQSRLQMSINFQMNLEGLNYKVGDTVNINYDRFSWTNKKFQITRLQIIPDAERGLVVDVECLEHNNSAYNWAASEQSDFDVTEDVDVYSGTEVVAPSNLRIFAEASDVIGNGGSRSALLVWDGVEATDGADPYEPYFSHYLVEVTDNVVHNRNHQTFMPTIAQQEIRLHSEFVRGSSYRMVISVKAVNIRGYLSDAVVLGNIGVNDVFPGLEENKDHRVFGTFSDPTADQLSALATEAGIVVENGTEILYIQLDDDGFVVDSQEYVFNTTELTAKKNANYQQNVGTQNNQIDPIRNGNFSDSAGWTLTYSTWNISNNMLVANYAQTYHYAMQNVVTPAEEQKLTFDILSITGTLKIQILDAITYQAIDSRTFNTTGEHTFTYTPNGSHIILLSSASGALQAQIDDMTLATPTPDARHRVRFTVNTFSEVTWSYTKSSRVNMTDTGVGETFLGFTGSNLRTGSGNAYVDVDIYRLASSVGNSQQRVEVVAEWSDSVSIDGTVANVAKRAVRTILFSVSVA